MERLPSLFLCRRGQFGHVYKEGFALGVCHGPDHVLRPIFLHGLEEPLEKAQFARLQFGERADKTDGCGGRLVQGGNREGDASSTARAPIQTPPSPEERHSSIPKLKPHARSRGGVDRPQS